MESKKFLWGGKEVKKGKIEEEYKEDCDDKEENEFFEFDNEEAEFETNEEGKVQEIPIQERKLATIGQTVEDERLKVLALHNQMRANLGLARMSLDDSLNERAKKYAEHLLKTQKFEHSKDREDEGENLAWSSNKNKVAGALYLRWEDERKYFKAGKYPDINKVKGEVVGHYSQIIWPASTKLGVGVARGDKGTVLVCRYRHVGNVHGQPVGYLKNIVPK